jgi:hypothetical protein
VVEGLLCDSLLGMMNMARKSGQFVTGSGKVDDAIRSGAARALMHASDAAEDGVRKLRQANTARAKGDQSRRRYPSFGCFQPMNWRLSWAMALLSMPPRLQGRPVRV